MSLSGKIPTFGDPPGATDEGAYDAKGSASSVSNLHRGEGTDGQSLQVADVRRFHQQAGISEEEEPDALAVEEPLEIQVLHYDPAGSPVRRTVSITMRTPGRDPELAAGFLFTEGLISGRDAIAEAGKSWDRPHEIRVELRPGEDLDPRQLDRHFYTTSSCGVCGKASIDAVYTQRPAWVVPEGPPPRVSTSLLSALPDRLRERQELFRSTGGIHGSGLFAPSGELLRVEEDVGRHNALDKLVGACLLAGELPLHDSVLLLSGRASFELVQKAAMAGIPVVAAVGAPSSLAVRLARQFGMTLVGFVRRERFNIYTGADHVTEGIEG